MDSVRQQKVNKLVAKELAEIFRGNARTMFNGAFITVTGVRVSPDLGTAKVYISIMGGGTRESVFRLVQDHTSAIRGKLGSVVGKQLRVVPALSFFIDDSLDYALRIDSLLKK